MQARILPRMDAPYRTVAVVEFVPFVRADGKTSDFLRNWPMERPKDRIEFMNG